MRLTELTQAFSEAEAAHPEHRYLLGKLQRAALDVAFAEKARGGEARQVVTDVARILGTDINSGPGHRWDADHMRRVVSAAEELKGRAAAANEWKALAEKHDGSNGPLRADLRRTSSELSYAQSDLRSAQAAAVRLREALEARVDDSDVDELKATIVSQAREIARLKGESA
ncbi:hypothetical protein OG709_29930 [Streptomyces sp. NBC_01267]|uniref:hypothetical protein n=1 Tax=Streptomyces sp. NBC_01267 TaxID=2903805 RepID=UPI002E3684E0|nr:hypothetical protein [Streptomyces sp. NBC_01267]